MNSTCKYCGTECRTLQGLHSHLAQSKSCRQKKFEEYIAADSSDDDSGSDSDSTNSEVHGQDLDKDTGDTDIDLAGPEGFETDAEQSGDEAHSAVDPPRPNLATAPILAEEAAATAANLGKRPRPTVEVEDEDARWFQPFPEERCAGARYGKCQTQFEKLRMDQKRRNQAPWEPFESEDEWELAQWLMSSGLSNEKIDKYLKLKKVREGINTSFHNSRAFLKRIDALPDGPKWTCYPFELVGDEVDADGKAKREVVEMWCRDPVECVRELVGNPAFQKQRYEPCRIFKRFEDRKYSNRELNEMWTADWWWEIQELLPDGATLVPIIIASDKTQLTRFNGDQQAWPVYLTIGNINKETRRRPSSHATVLIGYIPVAKLEIFSKKRCSGVGYQLFHDCMRTMLQSLKMAGQDGVAMDCADGLVRKMYLILAAYIADSPEQCLVCCCGENSCPGCDCSPKCRGNHISLGEHWRDPKETLQTLADQSNGEYPAAFADLNLRAINPFWAYLPHCNIFRSMTPDLLHELHNGVFGDHLVKWATKAMSGEAAEVDRRFRAMTPHPSLRHFKKGISLTTQWTGTECKNMEKVFLGVLANATDARVQLAAAGVLDFIHYAHFENHCDESLAELDAAWLAFHENKDIFVELGIRAHFNISKLHKLKHYVDSIRSRGTADGFNTEGTERLHIDLAKIGYRASNKKAYTRQMTVWLRRQEAVHKFGTYLQWAVPGYIAPLISDSEEVDDDNGREDDDEEDHDEEGPVRSDVRDKSDDEDDSDEEEELPSLPTFAIAKKPAFPNLPVATIITDFHAPAFLLHLEHFLESKSIQTAFRPADNSTFPVYKKFSLYLPRTPEVGSSIVRDTIRAVKSEDLRMTSKGFKPAKASQFDMVLARTHPRRENESPTDAVHTAKKEGEERRIRMRALGRAGR